MPAPKTLFDKIWDAHLVHVADEGTCLIYIDRHLVHEVTSPQAFEGLRTASRKVRRPNALWLWLTIMCRPQTEAPVLKMKKADPGGRAGKQR